MQSKKKIIMTKLKYPIVTNAQKLLLTILHKTMHAIFYYF